MFRLLRGFVVCAAVGLSSCFAAFSQAPLANAARPGGEAPQLVYTFDAREFLKLPAQRRHQVDCFCTDLDRCTGASPLTARRSFNLASPSSEIREIDLEGLKKLLQRDPKDTRPLLVNFWATWCDGCREEFPDLVKIDNDYRAKGLNFVSVTLDDITDIKTVVPEFLKEMKAQMPVVLLNVKDPEPAIHTVDVTWDGALPATYVYDKDGKVVYKHFGAIKAAELRSALDKLVGSKQ